MARTSIRRGVSKAEWLSAALKTLSDKGVGAVTVESLAKSLGIAKSGFYWHFRDRRELLAAVLSYWIHETTEIITGNPEMLELEPRCRLEKSAEMILDYDFAGYDLVMRQWALHDADAAGAVRKVNRLRLDFIRRAFAELGFEGEDLEMRTMLFVCYQSMEGAMFPRLSRKRRREMMRRRVALLTQPASSS